jgi:HlyD family secretion protein
LQADADRTRVGLEDAQVKLRRAQQLFDKQLIPALDVENAEATVRQAEASLKASEAQITQARGSLNQARVNLNHTIITAPVDGIVISRRVDVGQTVAASMSAPTLFVIAKDLAEMQVNASIDESDIGRIEAGQAVTFRVDAYPRDTPCRRCGSSPPSRKTSSAT